MLSPHQTEDLVGLRKAFRGEKVESLLKFFSSSDDGAIVQEEDEEEERRTFIPYSQ